ncbi:MAG: phosphotransferase [Oscillospiraceae bacterium]|nr:phosphotransferase [Oscillospiraceae bacterium]
MINEQFLNQALKFYDFKHPHAELLRHSENMTYKITDAEKKYMLRIHKSIEGFSYDFLNKGYSRIEMVQAELEIISSLKNGTNLPIQMPVYGINGDLVQTFSDNTPVTLLEWVEGQTLENIIMTPKILIKSGKLMAEIHSFFYKKTELNKLYKRYNFDQSILPKIAERIENAMRIRAITEKQADIIIKSLYEIQRRLDELDNMQEKHIVHADLGKSNVIMGVDGHLAPIDFGLCGYSHFYMDIAGIYGLNHVDGDSKSMIEEYKRVRKCEINPRYIEAYFAFIIILFLSSQYEMAKEWEWFPNKMDWWCRDIFKPLVNKTNFIFI